jgi:hypothetical protein
MDSDNTQSKPLEDKPHATRRLQREGRWEEASKFRRQVRSELRSMGTPKDEANEEAWRVMIEK